MRAAAARELERAARAPARGVPEWVAQVRLVPVVWVRAASALAALWGVVRSGRAGAETAQPRVAAGLAAALRRRAVPPGGGLTLAQAVGHSDLEVLSAFPRSGRAWARPAAWARLPARGWARPQALRTPANNRAHSPAPAAVFALRATATPRAPRAAAATPRPRFARPGPARARPCADAPGPGWREGACASRGRVAWHRSVAYTTRLRRRRGPGIILFTPGVAPTHAGFFRLAPAHSRPGLSWARTWSHRVEPARRSG